MRKRDFVLFVGAIVLMVVGLNQLNGSNKKNQQEIIEKAVSRAVIQCYAIEGAYPESIDYIKENYGLQIDTQKFIVHYEPIGPNIMPNIKVIYKQ